MEVPAKRWILPGFQDILHPMSLLADFPPVRLFAYINADAAPLYRAVLRIFAEAKARYRIHYRLDELHTELGRRGWLEGVDTERLERALDQLCEWGNLHRVHDSARVATLEDFRRRRYLYQLTPGGEAAERAVHDALATLAASGALQTVMLASILRNLEALAAELDGDSPRPERLFETLFNTREQFAALTENAGIFLARLHGAMDAGESVSNEDGASGDGASEDGEESGDKKSAEERFADYKEAVLAYLQSFVNEISGLAPRIADALHWVETGEKPKTDPPTAAAPKPSARWRREGESRLQGMARLASIADSAPLLGDEVDREPPAVRLERAFRDMATWFVGGEGEAPTVELLRGAARDAINRILRLLERLHEKRFRRADRAADLVRLAQWFESGTAVDDAEVHRLAQTAFGLFGARHLSGLDGEDGGEEREFVLPRASWWETPPVRVEPMLRDTGKRSSLGAAPKIVDRARSRRLMLDRHDRERARRERALASLAGPGARRLSELPPLDADERELLLHVLDRLFTVPPQEDGLRTARSRDGRLRLTLAPPTVESEGIPLAVVRTDIGTLRLADFALEIEDLTAV